MVDHACVISENIVLYGHENFGLEIMAFISRIENTLKPNLVEMMVTEAVLQKR